MYLSVFAFLHLVLYDLVSTFCILYFCLSILYASVLLFVFCVCVSHGQYLLHILYCKRLSVMGRRTDLASLLPATLPALLSEVTGHPTSRANPLHKLLSRWGWWWWQWWLCWWWRWWWWWWCWWQWWGWWWWWWLLYGDTCHAKNAAWSYVEMRPFY